jgi:hypothetical protein
MGWAERLGRWSFRCGVAAALAGLGFALAARWDWIGKLAGFYGVALALLLALIGLVLGLLALRRPGRLGVIGLLLSGALLTAVLAQILPHRGAPPIHDASTDLVRPPEYRALKLPADHLRGVGSVERWRTLHEAGYPDLRPLTVPASPAEVVAAAERLARARGWAVVAADPAAGRLEAIAYESPIRFEDLVVIVATPAQGGTRIDMRSVSRVGISDLGANYRRLRAFGTELSEALRRSGPPPRPS